MKLSRAKHGNKAFFPLLPILFLLLIPLFLAGCSLASPSEISTAHRGILDLTGLDLNQHEPIRLDGQWEFYWNRFLTYEDFQKAEPDLYGNVPSMWNKYSLNGSNLPGEGCATYRLHVKTKLPPGTQLGLRVYTFSSAYRLFINDKLVASNGRVAAKASIEVGEYKPLAVFFSVPESDFDIIVQVSNFDYARGGFWYSLFLGSSQDILDLHVRIMGKEIFLLGSLTIVFLFFLAIYLMRPDFRYCLYFACVCLTMALMVDMVGQFLILKVFPGISLKTIIFIWYTASLWVLFFIVLFVHELFKSRFSKAVVKFYLGFNVIFQMLYIFTPPNLYSKFLYISNCIQPMGVLCTVIIVAIGIRKGYRDGWLNLVSMVIVLAVYIHDTLYFTNSITSSFGEFIYPGLVLFIFIQMVIQANRIKLTYDRQSAAELSFLQAQIKPHFLYNTLNTIISISFFDWDRARELLLTFSNYLRRCFDFKDISHTVPLKNEIELAKSYVAIEKARFEERLEVNFSAPEDLETKVPMLVLQPLIENAVVHGILPKPEGGCIDVVIKKEGNTLFFSVKDNGVGMDVRGLNDFLSNKDLKGVGLANIDGRLKKLYGTGLTIHSSPGKGTEVTWSIQMKGKGKGRQDAGSSTDR